MTPTRRAEIESWLPTWEASGSSDGREIARAVRELLAEVPGSGMDLREFIRWLMPGPQDGLDIDGGDLQDAMVKHGLLVERPATAEDCESEWAKEWGYEVGDTMIDWTPALHAFLDKEPPA